MRKENELCMFECGFFDIINYQLRRHVKTCYFKMISELIEMLYVEQIAISLIYSSHFAGYNYAIRL